MATIKKKTAKDKGLELFQQAQAKNQVFTNVKGQNPATIQNNKLALTGQTGLLEGRQPSDKVVGSNRTKPGAISVDQMTPTSYEQIGAIQQEQDYQTAVQGAEDLGLDTAAPSTLEQYVQKQIEAKKTQDKAQNLALEGQRMDLRSQAQSIGSQSAAAQAMAASSLTGPQANAGLRGGYQEAAQAQLARLKIDDQQLALYDTQLKQAQLDGDLELAQSIQANKDAYVNQAMQNEAAYVAALGDYEKTKAAVTQSNLASFQSLVDEGQELSVEAISGFAGQLGIPFEDAYGYYAGLQSIRDDKSLSLEEKDVAIQQAKQDLQDQITGMDTQAAKNTKAYISLVQSGADEETIAAFKQVAGITDYNDPFTIAELKTKDLENQIKQYEVDYQGKPPPAGSKERLEYDMLKADLALKNYELNDLYGNPNGVLDPEIGAEVFKITPTGKYSEGSQYHDNWGGASSNRWECGEGYNQITDGAPVGSDYSEKMGQVTKRDNPMVGNGLVLPLAAPGQPLTTGHIETVISVSPSQIQTVSWNLDGKGTQTFETHNIDDLNRTYGENWGFTDSTLKPEYQSSLAAATATQDAEPYSYNSYYAQAIAQNMSPEAAEKYATTQFTAANSSMTEAQMKVYDAYVGGKLEEETYASILESTPVEDISDGLNVLTKSIKKDDTVTADIVNSLGVSDDVQRAMMSELAWIEAVLRKKSGAAITQSEYDTYGRMYFPRVGDSSATLADKERRRKAQIEGLYGQMSESGKKTYELTFGKAKPLDEDAIMQEAEKQAQFDSMASEDDVSEINSIFNQ